MIGETGNNSETGKKLLDDWHDRLRHQSLITPEKIPPEIPTLSSQILSRELNDVDDPTRIDILSSPQTLLCFALTRSDEYGRPLNISGQNLVEALNAVSGYEWTTNKIRREQKALDAKLHHLTPNPKNSDLDEQIFSKYLSQQTVFSDAHEAAYHLVDPISGRFDATRQRDFQNMLHTKAQEFQDLKTQIALTPPEDPKDWPRQIETTLRVFQKFPDLASDIRAPLLNASSSEPLQQTQIVLTDHEITPVAEMMRESVDAKFIAQEGRPGNYTETPYQFSLNIPQTDIQNYDPSLDVRDRFLFCLGITQISSKSPPEIGNQPPFVQELITLINAGQSSRRLSEFVSWVAYAGDKRPPSWLATKTVSTSSETDILTSETHPYLKDLPTPLKPIHVFYTPNPQAIPKDLGKINLKELTAQNEFTEIPLNDLRDFNQTLDQIRRSGNHLKPIEEMERVAKTIAKLAQMSEPDLQTIPASPHPSLKHLRAISYEGQAIGVHGQWTHDTDGNQVFLLTTQRKTS